MRGVSAEAPPGIAADRRARTRRCGGSTRCGQNRSHAIGSVTAKPTSPPATRLRGQTTRQPLRVHRSNRDLFPTANHTGGQGAFAAERPRNGRTAANPSDAEVEQTYPPGHPSRSGWNRHRPTSTTIARGCLCQNGVQLDVPVGGFDVPLLGRPHQAHHVGWVVGQPRVRTGHAEGPSAVRVVARCRGPGCEPTTSQLHRGPSPTRRCHPRRPHALPPWRQSGLPRAVPQAPCAPGHAHGPVPQRVHACHARPRQPATARPAARRNQQSYPQRTMRRLSPPLASTQHEPPTGCRRGPRCL